MTSKYIHVDWFPVGKLLRAKQTWNYNKKHAEKGDIVLAVGVVGFIDKYFRIKLLRKGNLETYFNSSWFNASDKSQSLVSQQNFFDYFELATKKEP